MRANFSTSPSRPFRAFASRSALTIGLLLVATGSTASAGTIRHDRSDSLYRSLAQQPQFAAVGRYSGTLGGSLTLIHPEWALTAAHVISDNQGNLHTTMGTITIGGNVRTATQFIVPRGVNGNPGWNGSVNDGFDIALVRLNSPITNITPATIYTGFQEYRQVVTMVGYGQTGNGTTGSTGSSGIKRAGQNVVDELFTMRNGLTGLRWDFDDPPGAGANAPNRLGGSNTPLDLEYQIASGDSGGGSFIQENGNWYLAAVHSATYDFFTWPGTNDSHTYGDVAIATRVSAYQQFIFNNIPDLAAASLPEPSSVALLGLIAGLLCGQRLRIAKSS